ncbi:MAG: histidinol dehydrogenase [Hyphomicrobiales bacterium]
MEIIRYPKREEWPDITSRPNLNYEYLHDIVKEIFIEVQKKGDRAVKRYTKHFDRIDLETPSINKEEIEQAKNELSEELISSIDTAYNNIKYFHESQISSSHKVDILPGVQCWQKDIPIEEIGLYIPGGNFPLFSSVLMLGIPAKIAGCKKVVLCTPPNEEGKINPALLYAAQKANIDNIYAVGGIQAIASMTFGTESIPKVNKIFGPGNQYVVAAKLYSTQFGTAIDMPAGPSELLIIADDTCKAEFIAADLLSQAEHGIDSQVMLVSWSEKIINEIIESVNKQLKTLDNKEVIERSLHHAKILLTLNKDEAIEIANFYAPEHLIIATEHDDYLADKVINAGSVFLGEYSPESAGDYASGTNHTLPTNGYAKSFSGLTVNSFCKQVSFQRISKQGLTSLASTITNLAKAEHLNAHVNSIRIRLKD